MEIQGKLKERSKSSAKLGKMLQQVHKGFGYQVMQLQMTIDDPNIIMGGSKMEDITKLVQLYMIGVQVLEGSKHKKYDYFRKKLQDLMKKKIVGEELKLDITEYMNDPNGAQNKRLLHLQQFNKIRDQHSLQHLNTIVNTAEQNVESCKGIIEGDIKKQQDKIKQRLASRSKTKRSDINSSLEKSKKNNTLSSENEYFVSTPVTTKSKHSNKDSEKRPQSRQNRFEARR